MANNRAKIYEILHGKYKYSEYNVKFVCFYCGMPADTVDHVPSLNEAYCIGLDRIEEEGIRLNLVHACRECNGLLGARESLCPFERRDMAQELLRKRYKRVLNMPDWSDEELEEIGRSMQEEIKKSVDLKRLIQRRVSFG